MSLSPDILETQIHVDGFVGSLRDFFKELSLKCWVEEEGFSGKRPFGNGGWKCEVYAALIEEGVLEGTLDEYGHVVECDTALADELLIELVVEHL